jgi:putative ABC transport system permease protein
MHRKGSRQRYEKTLRLAPLTTAIAVGFETLRANPLRTILSTLGVIIGVSALVAVLSVGDGVERSVRTQIEQTTDLQAITISPRFAEEVDGQFFPVANPARFTVDDVREMRALPGVMAAGLQKGGYGEIRSRDSTRRKMASIRAEIALRDSTIPDSIAFGRSLTTEEAASAIPIAVISMDLAKSFAPDSNATLMPGDSVLIAGSMAQVIGVLRARAVRPVTGRGRARGDYRVLVPTGFIDIALPTESRTSANIVAVARTVEETKPVRERIERVLAARDTGWQRRMTITTNDRRLEQLSSGILMFKLFLGAITGISLLVGGIGIMNVLLSSVTERTREIGIRKAVGARDNDILQQFLAESVAISSVGSGIGLALGIVGAYGITAGIRKFSEAPFLSASVSWSTLAVAAAAALLIGLTFGTYPARRAARLSPIDAIRHE